MNHTTFRVWPDNLNQFLRFQSDYTDALNRRADIVSRNRSLLARGLPSLAVPTLPPKPVFPFMFDAQGDYLGLLVGTDVVPEGATLRWKFRAND